MEELKLILETVATIGGYAYLLFILYLTKGLLLNVLWAAMFFFVVKGGFRLIQVAVDRFRFGDSLGFTSPLSRSEKERVRVVFDLGQEKWKSVYTTKINDTYTDPPCAKEDS